MDDTQSRLPVVSDSSVSSSIAEMESSFRYDTLAYVEILSIFSVRIESLKQETESVKSDLEPLESQHADTEKETHVRQGVLENINDRFCKKAESIVELESEYRSSLDKEEYKKILSRKTRELAELLDEVEQIEDDLLQIELERLNIFEKLEPKRDELSALRQKLNALELEKVHFESTGVHHIGKAIQANKIEESKDIIDIRALE